MPRRPGSRQGLAQLEKMQGFSWGDSPNEQAAWIDGDTLYFDGRIAAVKGPFADVRASGAIGNGVDDDAPFIQIAINRLGTAGGVVYVPRGTYIVGTALALPSGVHLIGDGAGISILKQKDGANLASLVNSTSKSNVCLRDLTIDGNKANNTAVCSTILMSACTDVEVSACEVKNTPGGTPTPGVAIAVSGAGTRIVVTRNYVHDSGTVGSTTADGIYVSGTRARITDNIVDTASDTGIVFESVSTSSTAPGDNTIIANNTIVSTPQGIAVSALVSATYTAGVVVTANTIAGCSAVNGAGIYAALGTSGGLASLSIVGNVLRDATNGHGIYVHFGTEVVISGNVINANAPTVGTHSILVEQCDRVSVAGNVVGGGGGNGIAVAGSTHTTVTGNAVHNCSRSSNGTYSGIAVSKYGAAESHNIVIVGNKASGSMQGRGLAVYDASDGVVVAGNDLRDNANNPGYFAAGTTGVRLGFNLTNSVVNSPETIDYLRVAGGLTVPGGTLLTASAALTNGAAAQTATLTNGPVAGNPTKWIPIVDNGVTRYIPAW